MNIITLYRRDYDEATWQTLKERICANCAQNQDFCTVTNDYIEVAECNLQTYYKRKNHGIL